MSQAYLHYNNMEDVRGRLENSIATSNVVTSYDGEDCFIIVTQRNNTTGNRDRWDFCVDFGTNKVQMLEPTEDEEGFTSDNEVFRIIKNFLNGGSSREKRMNRPDYDSGEPIKVTGFGNKIGSSRKPIKSVYDVDTFAQVENAVDDLQNKLSSAGVKIEDIYDGYFEDVRCKVLSTENLNPIVIANMNDVLQEYMKSHPNIAIETEVNDYFYGRNIYVLLANEYYIDSSRKPIKSGISPEQNRFNWAYNDWFGHFQMNLDRVPQYLEGVKWCDANKGTSEYEQLCKKYNCYPVDDREKASFYNALKEVGAITSSKKHIKSDFNPYYEKHPDTPVGYLLGGEADTVTDADKKAADEYELFYEGYGTMDGTEKGHLFIGRYSDIKSYFEDYMGHSLADDYIYPYKDSFGQHILDRFEIEMTWVLPTEKDYQDVVNKLNEYVDKEYAREFSPGSIYHFNMYKGEGMNTDGYGHEYPNYIIFDTEGNLDLFSGDEIVQYIDNLLAEKGWYHEAVSGSDNFTIAVNTN